MTHTYLKLKTTSYILQQHQTSELFKFVFPDFFPTNCSITFFFLPSNSVFSENPLITNALPQLLSIPIFLEWSSHKTSQ